MPFSCHKTNLLVDVGLFVQKNTAMTISGSQINKSIIDNRLYPRCYIMMNLTTHCSCLMSNLYRHLAKLALHCSLALSIK